jgi:AcrR family transcriptional regulator
MMNTTNPSERSAETDEDHAGSGGQLSALPPRERRRHHRREAILDVAMELFSKNGYADTSMVAIADAVDLTSAALYRYFPSKRAIMEQIFAERLRRRPERWTAEQRQEHLVRPLREALLDHMMDALERPLSEHELMVLVVRESVSGEDDARNSHAQAMDAVDRRTRWILRNHPEAQALSDEQVNGLALGLGYAFLGMLVDVLMGHLNRADGGTELGDIEHRHILNDARTMFEAILDAVVPRAAGR